MSHMNIGIIGSGVVGLATGEGLMSLGHNVIFNDVSDHTLSKLKQRGFSTEKNLEKVIESTDITFICVPTPTRNEKQDLTILSSVIENVAKALKTRSKYHLVVVRSTILPGTTRNKLYPIFEQHLGYDFSLKYGLCFNPEFLREVSPLEDFLNPNRIVIGENDSYSGEILEKLYHPLSTNIVRLDYSSAEMIKYVSNVFLATKISYFNEIYNICEAMGVDDTVISETVALDPRIGRYGIYGGKPFGGTCLPKDLQAFIKYADSIKVSTPLLDSVKNVNTKMSQHETQMLHSEIALPTPISQSGE